MSSIFFDSVSNSVKSHSRINRSRIISQISLPPSREIYFVIVNPLLSSLSLKKNLCVQILFSMHQVAKQASFFLFILYILIISVKIKNYKIYQDHKSKKFQKHFPDFKALILSNAPHSWSVVWLNGFG